MDSINGTVNHSRVAMTATVLGLSLFVEVAAASVIIGGNILTLLVIWRTESLRTIPNMYIVSLAIADLITGVLMFSNMLLLEEISNLHYNKYLCMSLIMMTLGLSNVSSLMMVLISLDRYLYIKYPLHYVMIVNSQKTKIAIASSWVISMVSNTYILFVNNWDYAYGCSYLTVAPKMIRAIHLLFFFIFQNALSLFFYGNILVVARRQQRSITSSAPQDPSAANQSRWKLIKLFLMVYGIFFFCVTPFSLFYILDAFISVPVAGPYVILPLLYVNAGANCFVYGWLNKDFRRVYREIFRSVCICFK